MATAQSDAAVCNLAFSLLRQSDRVTNIVTPSSPSETLGAQWYDPCRRSVLSTYPWNFARTRAVLSLNAIDPAFGYPDSYNLPNNFLAVVFIGDNYDDAYETDYSVEGNQILIDNNGASTMNICYIKDFVEVARFDPVFLDLLVAELAIRFMNNITGLNKNPTWLEKHLQRMEAKARMKNGHDNPIKHRDVSLILKKRRSGTTGGSTFDGTHLLS